MQIQSHVLSSGWMVYNHSLPWYFSMKARRRTMFHTAFCELLIHDIKSQRLRSVPHLISFGYGTIYFSYLLSSEMKALCVGHIWVIYLKRTEQYYSLVIYLACVHLVLASGTTEIEDSGTCYLYQDWYASREHQVVSRGWFEINHLLLDHWLILPPCKFQNVCQKCQ